MEQPLPSNGDPAAAAAATEPTAGSPSSTSVNVAAIGHPANHELPYPLSLVPFDLSHPYRPNDSLTIKPYRSSNVWLDRYWARSYREGEIRIERDLTSEHLYQHLRELIDDMSRSRKDDSDETRFIGAWARLHKDYGLSEKAFGELTVVQNTKVYYVDELLPSWDSEKDLTATQPDLALQTSSYRYNKGVRTKDRKTLHSVFALKVVTPATARYLPDPAERQRLDTDALRYTNLEALMKGMYYLTVAYSLSKCRSGIAWAKEYFTRIVNITRGPGPSPRGQTMLLEASPKAVSLSQNLPSATEGMTPSDLMQFYAQNTNNWEPPNALIQDHIEWRLVKEAHIRLDATIFMLLGISVHPASSSELPLLGEGGGAGAGGDGGNGKKGTKGTKRKRRSGKGGKGAARGDGGSSKGTTSPPPLRSPPTSNPSPTPLTTSPSTSTQNPHPKHAEHPEDAKHPEHPEDAKHPEHPEHAEQDSLEEDFDYEDPIEPGSLQDFSSALQKAAVRIRLITTEEMDVLLARAAKWGWAEAIGGDGKYEY
ncbi:hypothetical protein L202_07661 [Cryptococcus amylolentus CBS 6039]|uniref:Uncharacterized protein n=1 Tax=Cryptococcus amylolentus CBS 6039 TaxID=1295533 RepID=A0A1E3HDK9_9TREE|nr:hypothetical protein L202_07661 [Cryptococcus amylolentus CBS 6039]ODN74215.1 hypothetical protein L202_07661 [Cryptococcus amylolentus CBS 6039]